MKARDLLLFSTQDKKVNVSVFFREGTFWLTQKTMAELFSAERSVVTKHLKNIFATNELDEYSVCAKIAHTAADGKNYTTNFYRLEAILAVGYRVNSVQATD
ncbi:MAG: RhuM family protein [Bacteroidales bacterium]|nr:RhuM family protein [Bacteroidales bacterium]